MGDRKKAHAGDFCDDLGRAVDVVKAVPPIFIGISSCLLGERVRYDGGHKQDRFITDILAPFVRFVPVCPEVDVGMGVPREAVRLVGTPEAPHMVGRKTGTDWSKQMDTYTRRQARELASRNLSGYIFKKGSPSCGLERVKVYVESGMPGAPGVGLFAGAVMRQMPYLPVEDEGRLNDAGLRENFIERVFAYHRLQVLFSSRYTRRAVVDFHTAHKFQILSHSPKHYGQLGQLVAAVARYAPTDFRDRYTAQFMAALSIKATARKNVNVLQHILGFLKNDLATADKAYVLQVIADYHRGLVPLIAPITLLRHFVQRFDVRYIADQTYLSPHPKELMLRNHV